MSQAGPHTFSIIAPATTRPGPPPVVAPAPPYGGSTCGEAVDAEGVLAAHWNKRVV